MNNKRLIFDILHSVENNQIVLKVEQRELFRQRIRDEEIIEFIIDDIIFNQMLYR